MDTSPFIDQTIASGVFRRNVYNMIPEKTARILDVGCGDGALLLRLGRDKGCRELYGVELDPDLARPLAGVLDGVINVDVEKDEEIYAKFQGFFNCIVLHDVLEHLQDPWHTLGKLRSLAAPDALILVATPNLHHWRLQHEILSGKFPYGPGLWHTGHVRWYTPASLIELLLIGGLRIDELCLEIPDEVSFEHLRATPEVRRVEFPPREFQQGLDPARIIAVEYNASVKEYVPVFYAHKLIARCGVGELLMEEPRPVLGSCLLLEAMRTALNIPFDVYNPPHMRPLVGAWN